MKDKRLMVLGTGKDFRGIMNYAKKRGIYVVCCDGAEGLEEQTIVDAYHRISIKNIDKMVECAHMEKVDHVISSFSDFLFEYAATISSEAGLPYYVDTNHLVFLRDKV